MPTATASASGTIKKIYDWVPDGSGDGPPKDVIIVEYCTVSATGNSTANDRGPAATKPTGISASNGLGSPTAPPSENRSGNSWSVSQVSAGWRARKLSGANPLEITCAVGGSATATAPQYGSARSEVIVGYKVFDVIPIQVYLGGGIGTPGAKKYLIGQRVSATASPILTNPTWTVSGGSYFKSYTRTQSLGLVNMLQNADFHGSSFGCCFKEPVATTTIKVSGTFTAVTGESFSVEAERKATIKPPTFSTVAFTHGSVEMFSGYVLFLGNHEGEDGSGPLQQPGTEWVAEVTTPAEFAMQGSGLSAFTQLITPYRQELGENGGSVDLIPDPGSGICYLDDMPNYRGPNDQEIIGQANGQAITFTDSPQQPCQGEATSVSDFFNTYLMYLPPGGDSQWVALQERDWNWSALGVYDRWAFPFSIYRLMSGSVNDTNTTEFPWQPSWTRSLQL